MDPTLSVSPIELLHVLGTGQAPQLVDVCLPDDIAADPWRLPGAERQSHQDIGAIAASVHDSAAVVVICQKGLKLSHGVAAHLRAQGRTARALSGGVLAWSRSGFPRCAEAHAPDFDTCYVLPAAGPHDRLIAAWVIRRWLAPSARLLWVPAGMVSAVAERFEAVGENSAVDLLQKAGLDWPPVMTFVQSTDKCDWPRLLDALPLLHADPGAICTAALPIIDAAWMAHKDALQ